MATVRRVVVVNCPICSAVNNVELKPGQHPQSLKGKKVMCWLCEEWFTLVEFGGKIRADN